MRLSECIIFLLQSVHTCNDIFGHSLYDLGDEAGNEACHDLTSLMWFKRDLFPTPQGLHTKGTNELNGFSPVVC